MRERLICRHQGLGKITYDIKEGRYCIWSNYDPIGNGGFRSVVAAYKELKRMKIGFR